MEQVPLIPKCSRQENHDVAHVLNEVFQQVFSGERFPENIEENVLKYAVERPFLKNSASTAKEFRKLDVEAKTGFQEVEEEIMTRQGEFLINNDIIENDIVASEIIKLKRAETFRDIENEHIKKFNLLHKHDLLPNRAERSMNFPMNSNQHLCRQPCNSELDLIPSKLSTPKLKIVSPIPPICGIVPDSLLKETAVDRTRKLEGLQNKNKVFKAVPSTILFVDYKLHTTYEKKFKLRNVSRHAYPFVVRKLPSMKCFKLQALTQNSKIAPGMYAEFSVKYTTNLYRDVDDTVVLASNNGQLITINLKSRRDVPVLRVYTLKNIRTLTETAIPSESTELFDNTRASALNFTIDCGSCLLGNQINLNLILKNEGARARFFFITEEEWYFGDVNSLNNNLEMDIGGFQLHPSYFEIDREEFSEISLAFLPTHPGLHTEKFFLMCDNCNFEQIDIIGDGVLFEKRMIRIELPQKSDKISYMDQESDYYLYLGSCLPYTKQVCIITVHNLSCLEINFHWDVRKSVSFTPTTKLQRLDESWVDIKHNTHYLPPDSTTSFEITLNVNVQQEGFYSVVLGFYADDIPEVSLTENMDFIVIEKNENKDDCSSETKCLDVLIGEIEVALQVIPIQILIEPDKIILPMPLMYQEELNKKIQLRTDSKYNLLCKWKLVNKKNGQKCCVFIEPSEFELTPEELFVCTVTIMPHTYEDVDETLILFINNGLSQIRYRVAGRVYKPQIEFSASLLNFGYLPKGVTDQKTFYVISYSQEPVNWKIIEFTYDFLKQRLQQIDRDCMSVTSGTLEKFGDKAEVIYKVHAQENHRWFSFLLLMVSHPSVTAMNSLILVTYEVCQPKLLVHSPSTTAPILCPPNLLFLGIKNYYVLCLHNVSNISAYFVWGRPVGDHAEFVNIQFHPAGGILKPKSVLKVSVTLTAEQTGILDNIYVPCFVGRMDEPIIVTVMCAVDNINVKFLLPCDDNDRYLNVLWPPKIVDDFYYETLMFSEEKPNDIHVLYQKGSASEPSNHQLNKGNGTDYCYVPHNSLAAFPVRIAEFVGENTPYDATSTELKDYQLSSEEDQRKPLRSYFDSDIAIEETCIEVRNVPLRKPIKKTFYIQNMTPMVSSFSVELTNFEAVHAKRDILQEVLVDMGYKKMSLWEKTVIPEVGIGIHTNPCYGKIIAHDTIEVDIWIFATTWGIYVEEVVVEINDITPFCFSMFIEVVGLPLEYPIAPSSLNKDPILRFGNIPYKADPLQRKLKVTNSSAAPVSIVWHVFLQSKDMQQPFNLIFDVHVSGDSDEDEHKSLFISDEFYGKEIGNDIFQIEPLQLEINAMSTATMSITFSPKIFSVQFDSTEVEALLVGYIYVNEKNRMQQNYLVRPTAPELEPTKVRLSLKLEMPTIKIEHVRGDLKISEFANTIVREKDVIRYMRLIFKNASSTNGILSMHVNEPFEVISMQTVGSQKDTSDVVVVDGGGCVEVIVRCTITADMVLRHSRLLHNPNLAIMGMETVEEHNSRIKICRHLNIHQNQVQQQTIPLELVLIYPELNVSPQSINFGNVYIGNAKKNFIILKNEFAIPVDFEIITEDYETQNFIIEPTKGTIPPALGVHIQELPIIIHFLPTDMINYHETIKVHTITSYYPMQVVLTGVGTPNEKFYSEGV